MDLFICTDTFITLRAAPSHRAEMTNQILFGERFQVIGSCLTWLKIKASFDGYTGWIDSHPGGYKVWREEPPGIITGGMLTCIREDGSRMTLMPGSELFGLRDDLSSFSLGDEHFLTPGTDLSMLAPHVSVEETALHFLNAPYLWGGRTPAGTDCSGLVQTVFKIHGTGIPRNAAKQAATGTTINFFSEAEPGDVLFFSEDSDEIAHTGILYDSVTLIHAYGRVRKDRVDHLGIWDSEKACYTHKLRIIKRVIR